MILNRQACPILVFIIMHDVFCQIQKGYEQQMAKCVVAQGHRGREGGSRGTPTTLLPGKSCVLILQRISSLAATAYQLWLAGAQ